MHEYTWIAVLIVMAIALILDVIVFCVEAMSEPTVSAIPGLSVLAIVCVVAVILVGAPNPVGLIIMLSLMIIGYFICRTPTNGGQNASARRD
jgi:hypothetical protein